MKSREELEAEILEYRHALEEVVDCMTEPGCEDCRAMAQGALDGLNREMCLEMVREHGINL